MAKEFVNLKFRHLQRMDYGKTLTEKHKKDSPLFVDQVCIESVTDGYPYEIHFVWYNLNNDGVGVPRLEVFNESISFAYSDVFRNVIENLRDDFTPNDLVNLLESYGFEDASDFKRK